MSDKSKELKLREAPEVALRRAMYMREHPTPAERFLSTYLLERENLFGGVWPQEIFTFPDTFYIADLWIPKCRTILELDGSHHANQIKQLQHDYVRDVRLAEHGWGNITVLRVPNECVYQNEFLLELVEYLVRRKAEVAAWAKKFFQARRRQRLPSRPPVAAERDVCVCASCGNSHKPADPRKDVRAVTALNGRGLAIQGSQHIQPQETVLPLPGSPRFEEIYGRMKAAEKRLALLERRAEEEPCQAK